jgi:hypothetical protein
VSVRLWNTASGVSLTSAHPEAIVPTSFLKPTAAPTQSLFILIDKRERKKLASQHKESSDGPVKQTATVRNKKKCLDSTENREAVADIDAENTLDITGRANIGLLRPLKGLPEYYQVRDGFREGSSNSDSDKLKRVADYEESLKSFWDTIDDQWFSQSPTKRTRITPDLALVRCQGKDTINGYTRHLQSFLQCARLSALLGEVHYIENRGGGVDFKLFDSSKEDIEVNSLRDQSKELLYAVSSTVHHNRKYHITLMVVTHHINCPSML